MGQPGGGVKVEEMVKTAIKVGYRHFDTASGYGNEEHVGKAVRESGIPRSEIFLTTKLWNHDHGRVKEAFEESLARLNCDYIDLYLIHWPQASTPEGRVLSFDESPNFVETWKSMEALLDTGKVKSIGVSNFSIKTFEVLLPEVKVPPAVNQIQMHPAWPQQDIRDYCNQKGIHITAYSPLGQNDPLFYADPDCQNIAEKHKATVAQVLISWEVHHGMSVIPKSENPDRIKSNFQILDLDDEDIQSLNNFHKKPGMHKQLLSGLDSETGTVFGWTLEQLGWKLDRFGNAHY